LAAGSLKRHGKNWLALIAKARATPSESWSPPRREITLTPEQERLVEDMMTLVRLRAAQESISAQTLASRKHLEQLLVTGADIPLLHGWRAALAGHEVKALLRDQTKRETQDKRLSQQFM
jgi:ribonuclease D